MTSGLTFTAHNVRLDDGTEKNAELIAVDDKADIALMKVKSDSSVPYLKLADDNPKQAAGFGDRLADRCSGVLEPDGLARHRRPLSVTRTAASSPGLGR